MYKRKYLAELSERFMGERKFIQIILGPRQVGKTTLAEQFVQQLQSPYQFVSADDVPATTAFWIDQQWEAVRLRMKSNNYKEFVFVIDEIQKIHNWSEAVKKNWDQDSRNGVAIKLLLLGSSNISLQKGLTESLTGRFETIYLPHWSFTEMHEAFGLSAEEFVYYGGYPGSASLIKDEKRWKDYIRNSIIETIISKDVLQLTPVQKPALLKNLFEFACKYSGEILSYTKMLGQLHDAGNTTTLAHYQHLLDKSWMIAGLQKYSGSQVLSRASIPKWIAYNTALISAYGGTTFQQELADLPHWGRRVEQAAGAYLLNRARINAYELAYWRDGNDEVDFILEKGEKIIALEINTGKATFHKGIERFNKKYQPYKNVLISAEAMPWEEFLKLDIELLF